jgi:hypothetical protein
MVVSKTAQINERPPPAEGDAMTKRTKKAAPTPASDTPHLDVETQPEPGLDPGTAPVETAPKPSQPEKAEAIDTEAPLILERQKNGTLKPYLIGEVRAHAKAKIADDDDEDGRWATVTKATDAAIWEIIQGCSYRRGALTMAARFASTLKGGR